MLVGSPGQSGASGLNQRIAKLGEVIAKAIHLALVEVCPNCNGPVDLGDSCHSTIVMCPHSNCAVALFCVQCLGAVKYSRVDTSLVRNQAFVVRSFGQQV